MEQQVDRLVHKAWDLHQRNPPSRRLLIAISGIPGSGKTTLAALITHRLNALTSTPLAAFLPMDGYHLSRAQLSALPDPATAHARRGAAFTFDGASFLALVRLLRAPVTASTPTYHAPSFDHAVKDPVADDIAIPATARIVVFEGNYLSLDKEPWREAAALMDERWFVEVGEERARSRLVERHVRTGVAGTREEAERRVEENDLVNGREIVEGRWGVSEVVVSVEDGEWKPGGRAVESQVEGGGAEMGCEGGK